MTCQPDGVDAQGKRRSFSLGFFHKKRSNVAGTAKVYYQEAISKMRDTQCDSVAGEDRPTGAFRRSTTQWPLADGETYLNPEGGSCGMPTQFLGTDRVEASIAFPDGFPSPRTVRRSARPTHNHSLPDAIRCTCTSRRSW